MATAAMLANFVTASNSPVFGNKKALTFMKVNRDANIGNTAKLLTRCLCYRNLTSLQ